MANALYAATFTAYENIIDLCIDERVDALLVAGDVYDSADRSLRAQLKFVEGLKTTGRGGHTLVRLSRQPRSARWLGGEAGLSARSCKRFGEDVRGGAGVRGRSRNARWYTASAIKTRDVY